MIQWENSENAIPIKSWCSDADETALEQSRNLARTLERFSDC
jgi:hypothetical protein